MLNLPPEELADRLIASVKARFERNAMMDDINQAEQRQRDDDARESRLREARRITLWAMHEYGITNGDKLYRQIEAALEKDAP